MEDDILERMFNKHNNNENSEYNSNNNIIKCKFDLESIKHNEEVIQHIEKKVLMKIRNIIMIKEIIFQRLKMKRC